MKHITFLTFVFSFVFLISASAQEKFDGLWGGFINVKGLDLEVNFEVQTQENRVLLSVPLQKIIDQPGTGLVISGDTITFDYSRFNASYKGVFNNESQEIRGVWTQGLSAELNLKRVSKKGKINRTQIVKSPYPYKHENFKFPNEEAGIDLGGTLTIPNGEGPFPLAILISGSGPQDRNCEILDHKPFLVIADHLTRNGIAVLRYDDRGVQSSGGNFKNSTTADFTTDAAAAIKFAEMHEKIDTNKIGLIGHSEGGMIAPKVAADYNNVDFIVSLAGPAIPIAEMMTLQNQMIFKTLGMSEEGTKIAGENLPIIYSIVNQDKEPKELFDTLIDQVKYFYNALNEQDRQILGPTSSVYYTVLSKSIFTPWFRYFLAYDPEPSWQKVKCPVLALNGSEDIQISAKENLAAIKKNLEIAENKNHTEIELEGYNHLMQKCEVCSVMEYGLIETTFEPEALDLITEFILGLE
ncbi:MAG: alpha/beta fold hydrolase [Bacteroidota bacterium]